MIIIIIITIIIIIIITMGMKLFNVPVLTRMHLLNSHLGKKKKKKKSKLNPEQ